MSIGAIAYTILAAGGCTSFGYVLGLALIRSASREQEQASNPPTLPIAPNAVVVLQRIEEFKAELNHFLSHQEYQPRTLLSLISDGTRPEIRDALVADIARWHTIKTVLRACTRATKRAR